VEIFLIILIISDAGRPKSRLTGYIGFCLLKIWRGILADFSPSDEKKGMAAYRYWGIKWDTPEKMGCRSLQPGFYQRDINRKKEIKRQNIL